MVQAGLKASPQDAFEIKTDGELTIDSKYLTDDDKIALYDAKEQYLEDNKVPGKDLVADYMRWYYKYSGLDV